MYFRSIYMVCTVHLKNACSILANPMICVSVIYDANGTINEKLVVFVATNDILAECDKKY